MKYKIVDQSGKEKEFETVDPKGDILIFEIQNKYVDIETYDRIVSQIKNAMEAKKENSALLIDGNIKVKIIKGETK